MGNNAVFVTHLLFPGPAFYSGPPFAGRRSMNTRLYLFLAASLLLGGCIRTDRYEPQPQPQQYEFVEDFNNNARNWAFYDPANNAEVQITGGKLKYTYYPSGTGSNTVAVNTGSRLNTDFSIQTGIRNNNAMGLVFGVSPSSYGYSFFIDPNGYFAIYDEGDASHAPQTLIDWAASNAIGSGWNDLELTQQNGYWTGYCNGVQLFAIASRPLYGQQVGFIVLDHTTGYADYLYLQWWQ